MPSRLSRALSLLVLAASAGAQCTITGTAGNDVLNGTAGADVICALAGNDTVNAMAGADRVRGGADDDILWGGRDNDQLLGDKGNDFLRGDLGADSVDGGEGNDRFAMLEQHVGSGADTVTDVSGDDLLWFLGQRFAGSRSVRYYKVGNELQIRQGSTVLFRIPGYYNAARPPIEHFHFDTQPLGDPFRPVANNAPYGHLDVANATRVGGWAFDPNDTVAATRVRIVVTGGTQTVVDRTVSAQDARADVLNAHETPRAAVGFNLALTALKAGDYTVVATALDDRNDARLHTEIGRRTLRVTGNAPVGAVESAGIGATTGWAQDPDDKTKVVTVRVKVGPNTVWQGPANLAHTKVPGHGFAAGVDTTAWAAGSYVFRVFALDYPFGTEHEISGSPITLRKGTAGDDVIDGDSGRDAIIGLFGHDRLSGGPGADELNGNQGRDDVNGNEGDDDVRGGMDDDIVHGGRDDDLVRGDRGNDFVYGDLGDDEMRGGEGDDRLVCGPGDDALFGEAGNDVYFYGPGDGDDVIEDLSGRNRLLLTRLTPNQVTLDHSQRPDLILRIASPLGSGTVRVKDYHGLGRIDIEYPPNVIVIFADDLGYGDVGAYATTPIQTPRLDRMAREGLRCTDFYSGAAVCPPARGTLMSGKHTGHSYRHAQGRHMVSATRLLPAALRDRGYRTAVFGKWGFSWFTGPYPGVPGIGDPTHAGFDDGISFLSHRDAHVYLLDSPASSAASRAAVPYYGPAWPDPVRQRLYASRLGRSRPYPIATGRYTQDELIEQALAFIGNNKNVPFFLYLPFTLPHAELYLPKSDPAWAPYLVGGKSRFPEIPWLGGWEGPAKSWGPEGRLFPKWRGQASNYRRANPEPRATYAAMVTRLDRDVGRVLDQLKSLGLDERTLVLFSSDNGPHDAGGIRRDENPRPPFPSAGGLRGRKFTLWEGGIRVPMIARWPGRIGGGRTTAHPAALWDFYATIAEVTGAPVPPGLDSISLVPLLTGNGVQRRHEHLYWEHGAGTGGTLQALRRGDFKAVRISKKGNVGTAGDRVQLYDLSVDRTESNDLAGRPEHCFRLETMKDLMNRARRAPPSQLGASFTKIVPLTVNRCPPPVVSIRKTATATTLGVTHHTLGDIDLAGLSFKLNGFEVLPAIVDLLATPLVSAKATGDHTLELTIHLDLRVFTMTWRACNKQGSCATARG